MRVLIATDGSEFSKAAIEKTCEIVNLKAAKVLCYSCFETIPVAPGFISSEYYEVMADSIEQSAEEYVKEAKEQIEKHFGANEVSVETETESGFPDHQVVQRAIEWKADLIVVGSHGRGFWGRLLGSVSNSVAHNANCPVLIIKRPPTNGNGH